MIIRAQHDMSLAQSPEVRKEELNHASLPTSPGSDATGLAGSLDTNATMPLDLPPDLRAYRDAKRERLSAVSPT